MIENNVTCEIFFIINLEEIEKVENKKSKVKLYKWRLFHEIGHVFDIEGILKNEGYNKLEQYMEEYEQEIEDIIRKIDNREISEKEGNKKYNQLKREREATKFGKQLFRIYK